MPAEADPRLRRGVRLVFDEVRGRHALLYPEGVLLVNDTAAAIVRLCDGTLGVAGIVAALQRTYRGVRASEVREVLATFVAAGVVDGNVADAGDLREAGRG